MDTSRHGVSRVALLSLHSSPEAPLGRSDAGGMNVYVRRLAHELADLGVKVDMFTRRTDFAPQIETLEPNVRLVQLDAGPPSAVPKRLLPRYIPSLSESFSTFVRNQHLHYDIVNCHYWLSGLVGIRSRADIGAPVISMFHTLSKVKDLYLTGSDRNDALARFDGERQVLLSSDAIVGATTLEFDQFASLYGATPKRFVVIPPGVDTELFRPYPQSASRRRLRIGGSRVILYVGRLDPMKQLDKLLQAVAMLPPEQRGGLTLVLVGGRDSIDRDAARKFLDLAASLGIEHLVDMRPNVPQSELPLYYSAADICAVPSAYESFGMVAIESLACETPVVAFDVGGMSTTVEHERTGFLAKSGHIAEYSRALEDALTSRQLRTMGRRGRLSVQRYDWSLIGRHTLDLYTDVVAARDEADSRLAGVG